MTHRTTSIFATLLIALALSACETGSPGDRTAGRDQGNVNMRPLGPSVPDADAVSAGRNAIAAHKSSRRESLHPVYDPMLQNVGSRLAPVFPAAAGPWRFTLLSDPSPRVFASPDGQVIVHSGYAANMDPDSLAAGIAREMAHVLLRHPGQRMHTLQQRGIKDFALTMPYTPAQRRQAEALAKQYLPRARFNTTSADILFRAQP